MKAPGFVASVAAGKTVLVTVAFPTVETVVEDHNAVCPWCLTEMSETRELRLDDGGSDEVECGGCERPFSVVASVCVTYYATRIAGPPTEAEHRERTRAKSGS